jgi:16S rRNA (cytosine1402-N4)-methyltransferase
MNGLHRPVLLEESRSYLITVRSGAYFDGTLGFGGHAEAFLKELGSDAVYVAVDVDEEAFNFCRKQFTGDERVKLYKTNFTKIDAIGKIEMVDGFTGIFADLGVSSYQLDEPEEGFTYRSTAPLDMRLDKSLKITAADVINSYSENEIADIIYNFGEERQSRRIARRIVEERAVKAISTTTALADIVRTAVPKLHSKKTLSRVFQALRIFVNEELDNLKEFLGKAVDALLPEGRIVVLTYHSLEDRIVKEFFKYEASDCICPPDFPVCRCEKKKRLEILTKKPVAPGQEEISENPRARSAKLRAAVRV